MQTLLNVQLYVCLNLSLLLMLLLYVCVTRSFSPVAGWMMSQPHQGRAQSEATVI